MIDLPLPTEAKAALLVDQLRRRRIDTFIETGTFQGDTVALVRAAEPRVQVSSIEVDPVLHARAQDRFANDLRVVIYRGDSAEVLPRVLAGVFGPALFWLDAHYIGSEVEAPPVLRELSAVLAHGRACAVEHVIAIDDVRLFGFAGGYPPLRKVIETAQDFGQTVDVVLDIAWVGPRNMVIDARSVFIIPSKE